MKTNRLLKSLCLVLLSAGLPLSLSGAQLQVSPDGTVHGLNDTGDEGYITGPALIDSFFDVFTELSFSGPPPTQVQADITVVRRAPFTEPLPPEVIPVELVALNLVSVQPVNVTYAGIDYNRLSVQGSGGQVTGSDLGGGTFAIDSFFDIFVYVDLYLVDGVTGTTTQHTQVGGPEQTTIKIVPEGTGPEPVPEVASTFLLSLISLGLLPLARKLQQG